MEGKRVVYNEADLLDPHMIKKNELIEIVSNHRYQLLRNFGLGGLGFGVATQLASQNFKKTDSKTVSWLNEDKKLVLTTATVAGGSLELEQKATAQSSNRGLCEDCFYTPF